MAIMAIMMTTNVLVLIQAHESRDLRELLQPWEWHLSLAGLIVKLLMGSSVAVRC
jgi:hypothetical protein